MFLPKAGAMSYLNPQGKFPACYFGGMELLHKRISRVPKEHLVLGASEKPAIGTPATYMRLLFKRVVRSLMLMARPKDAVLTSLVINVNEMFIMCVYFVYEL